MATVKGFKLFVSYSHRDLRLQEELENHLAVLRHEGIIDQWSDRDIRPGEEWSGEIDPALNAADIILLLISADFLASNYCYDVEMRRALERHSSGQARVIPVILRPCDWVGSPFGNLQAVPRDGKPVTSWTDRDGAWVDAAMSVRLVCSELALQKDETKTSRKPTETRRRFKKSAGPGGVLAESVLPLFEVFLKSGVPTVTFVEPERFKALMMSIAQPEEGT